MLGLSCRALKITTKEGEIVVRKQKIAQSCCKKHVKFWIFLNAEEFKLNPICNSAIKLEHWKTQMCREIGLKFDVIK